MQPPGTDAVEAVDFLKAMTDLRDTLRASHDAAAAVVALIEQAKETGRLVGRELAHKLAEEKSKKKKRCQWQPFQ